MHSAKTLVWMLILLLSVGVTDARDKASQQPALDKEMKKFDGIWTMADLVIGGKDSSEIAMPHRLVFEDGVVTGKLLREFIGIEGMKLRLDLTTSPKLVDMVEWDQDFKDADEVLECVYKFDGDTLKLCFHMQDGRPAKRDRPTALESKEGSNTVLLTLKREKQ